MGGGCLRRTHQFSWCSIRQIRFRERPKASNQVSSMEYPARFLSYVIWSPIGTQSFSTRTKVGTSVVSAREPSLIVNWLPHDDKTTSQDLAASAPENSRVNLV